MRQTSKATVSKARTLRRTMSPPEARLWQILQQRPDGIKFRRQHPAGPYVVDFYCPSARLAIEVDGEAHGMGRNAQRDARRDAWLTGQGFTVLRITASELRADPNAAVAGILQRCRELHSPSTTLRAVPLPIASGDRED